MTMDTGNRPKCERTSNLAMVGEIILKCLQKINSGYHGSGAAAAHSTGLRGDNHIRYMCKRVCYGIHACNDYTNMCVYRPDQNWVCGYM